MKLNVGGQQTIDRFPSGWTCVDVLPGADVVCDIAESPLPFKDDRAEAIYCSHVLEHIWPWRLSFVLQEFHRVLISGAPVRIVVPDMDIAIQEYLDYRSVPDAIDICMRWWFDPSLDKYGNVCLNHVNGFNYEKMAVSLYLVGFRDIRKREYGSHRMEFFDCDNPGHKGTSLYVEAKK